MAHEFFGTREELDAKLKGSGFTGEWTDEAGGKVVFRPVGGGVLNWWPSKGTIQAQGKAERVAVLEAALGATALAIVPEAAPAASQIFIVHGHDTDARDQLELALRRLGLEPYVLMNTSGGGKTIIEALEGTIGKDHSSDFGIVLMTPDDIGYAKAAGDAKAEPRARQNVILETGMLLASLTRDKMAIIVKGHVEIPSDLEGIIRYHYNDHIKEIAPKLASRLREVGFNIGAEQIAQAAG